MITIRDSISLLWTLVSASMVVSLVWFLFETRKNKDRVAGQAATALAMIFGGFIISQIYVMLTMSSGIKGQVPLDKYFFLALLAVGLAMTGGVWSVWIFRPRKVPGYAWILGVAASGLALMLIRIFVLVN